MKNAKRKPCAAPWGWWIGVRGGNLAGLYYELLWNALAKQFTDSRSQSDIRKMQQPKKIQRPYRKAVYLFILSRTYHKVKILSDFFCGNFNAFSSKRWGNYNNVKKFQTLNSAARTDKPSYFQTFTNATTKNRAAMQLIITNIAQKSKPSN